MTVPDKLRWTCQPFRSLPPEKAYGVLRLRAEVFVVEQTCPYLDLDGKDLLEGVWQLFAEDAAGDILACLRVLAPGLSFAEPALGRVATSLRARRSGLGRTLMRRGIEACAQRFPGLPIRIGAQAYLIPFYESLGFAVASPPYDEDGIPHVEMLRAAAPA
ncbi:GNAT family N-acetyltransferase [Pseudomarimonas salicorniae]|uniref:GNAT family N-acetyltransferase n=1 Tax=Pseudomarimonas salicorniae TaxID=2933270 RepID=A0ABT0GKL5_9GAMM|nr:GNAT family N-acetyltransferase [Lysobacter sp. CAU 1642]MCK7595089.1 GNAT family N-acetyltransferase [Lysobacter sp. CAU 1642]